MWKLFDSKCAACGTRTKEAVAAPRVAGLGPKATVCKSCADRFQTEAARDIIDAATRGDALAVRALLDKGVDPNLEDNDRLTPVMFASRKGHREVAQVLFQKGAKTYSHLESGFGWRVWPVSSSDKLKYDQFKSRINKFEKRMGISQKQKDHLEEEVAVTMLLDLVKEVPSLRIDGDHPFDALLDRITYLFKYQCSTTWIGPLFKRASSDEHIGYGWIAVNLTGGGARDQRGTNLLHIFDSIGGPPRSKGVDSALMDNMVAILRCAESSRPWVKEAALGALDILKSFFLEPDQATNDLTAWRNSLASLARPGVTIGRG
jgi:hypothetical protein